MFVVPTTVDLLNRLLTLHSRSLPMYLFNAPPWFPQPESEAAIVLRNIAEDQQLMVDRIGHVILDQGGSVWPSEFPMEFTGLHDLSIDYLIPELIARQQREIEWMRPCAESLQDNPTARAITEEALGAAQGHLDSLQELLDASAGVPS
jgi:hypothetical protein